MYVATYIQHEMIAKILHTGGDLTSRVMQDQGKIFSLSLLTFLSSTEFKDLHHAMNENVI